MDYGPDLNRDGRTIANALMRYAEKEGWGPGDYRVFIRSNPDWGRLHVVFVARGFEDRDNFESYLSVLRHLEDELKSDPELLQSINLVVSDFKQIERGGIFGLGPDYSEVPIPA